MASSKSKTAHVDEDVDDLDDVLDQFSSPLPKPTVPAESSKPVLSSSSQRPPGPSADDAFSDAFTAEFAKGMESLLKELENTTLPVEKAFTEEEEKMFKDAWDKIMDPSTPASTSTAPANAAQSSQEGSGGSFQERVRQTMGKMKEGQSSLKSGDVGGEPGLEALLSSLNNTGADEDGEEGLQGLLETMMSQLMSKEVLYEPLKEMHEKFPSYLTENENKLSEEDKDRYSKQQRIVSQIIKIFETKEYSEEDPQIGLKVMSLMNEMQECGAPPTEIMGELPPGVVAGPDGMPQLPGECHIM